MKKESKFNRGMPALSKEEQKPVEAKMDQMLRPSEKPEKQGLLRIKG